VSWQKFVAEGRRLASAPLTATRKEERTEADARRWGLLDLMIRAAADEAGWAIGDLPRLQKTKSGREQLAEIRYRFAAEIGISAGTADGLFFDGLAWWDPATRRPDKSFGWHHTNSPRRAMHALTEAEEEYLAGLDRPAAHKDEMRSAVIKLRKSTPNGRKGKRFSVAADVAAMVRDGRTRAAARQVSADVAEEEWEREQIATAKRWLIANPDHYWKRQVRLKTRLTETVQVARSVLRMARAGGIEVVHRELFLDEARKARDLFSEIVRVLDPAEAPARDSFGRLTPSRDKLPPAG
jgi:hypothetical protein